MSFHAIFEDPSYSNEEPDFYYDLDENGEWVEVYVDAEGNPIVPADISPFATINS